MIYFGGFTYDDMSSIDKVAEFKNLGWNLLGNLAGSRSRHQSIKMGYKIYVFLGNVAEQDGT